MWLNPRKLSPEMYHKLNYDVFIVTYKNIKLHVSVRACVCVLVQEGPKNSNSWQMGIKQNQPHCHSKTL